MKFAVSDDVGQVKVITSTPGVDTTVKPTPTTVQPKVKSFLPPDAKDAVLSMCIVETWRDGTLDAIAIAQANGNVSVLHPDTGTVLYSCTPRIREGGRFNTISYNPQFATVAVGTSTGDAVFVPTTEHGAKFEDPKSYSFQIAMPSHKDAGFETFRMHGTLKGPRPGVPGAVAFAGRQRDLEIWTSKEEEDGRVVFERAFIAKNVKNDQLNRAVPIWVTDLSFLSSTAKHSFRVLAVSQHSYIRVYNTATSRRPIMNIVSAVPSAIHSLCVSPIPVDQSLENLESLPNIVLSCGNGDVLLYSLAEKRPIGKYRTEATGIISRTDISQVKKQDGESVWILSAVGADRYIRAWDMKTRKLVSRIWAKTRGTGVGILCSSGTLEEDDLPLASSAAEQAKAITAGTAETKAKTKTNMHNGSNEDGGDDSDDDSGSDDEELWDAMENADGDDDDEGDDQGFNDSDVSNSDSDELSEDEVQLASLKRQGQAPRKKNLDNKRPDSFSGSKPKRRKT